MITELEHQVSHLQRSQVEIQNFLVDDPTDKDLKIALKENCHILIERLEKIKIFKTQLAQIDPAYSIELALETATLDKGVDVDSESLRIKPSNPPMTTSAGIYL
jgi:hypothetical protein